MSTAFVVLQKTAGLGRLRENNSKMTEQLGYLALCSCLEATAPCTTPTCYLQHWAGTISL